MDKRLNIVITSGPTNEPIDSVMQITNMSTGSLGARIAGALLDNPSYAENINKIYFLTNKLGARPAVPDGQRHKLFEVIVWTTDDLLNSLRCLLRNPDEHIDAVIHSAAVGDYKGRYAARAEDIAAEAAAKIVNIPALPNGEPDRQDIEAAILDVLKSPACIQNGNSKISSYEPNLMCMLDLTPKVISQIKKWSPDTMLIGFKLLKGVSKDHLLKVASELRERNGADFIMANDLDRIGSGRHWGMVVGRTGIVAEYEGKGDIAAALARAVMAKRRLEHNPDRTAFHGSDSMPVALTDEQKLFWPWWYFGWTGVDGIDWRGHATGDGLGGVPDISEEAAPLTLEEARNWGLAVPPSDAPAEDKA